MIISKFITLNFTSPGQLDTEWPLQRNVNFTTTKSRALVSVLRLGPCPHQTVVTIVVKVIPELYQDSFGDRVLGKSGENNRKPPYIT